MNQSFSSNVKQIGVVRHRSIDSQDITIRNHGKIIMTEERNILQQCWSRTSFEIQKLRDDPICAHQEFDSISNDDCGLFEYSAFKSLGKIIYAFHPRVAVLREQGINGHVEMANAFYKAGFEVVDLHMTDLIEKRVSLKGFDGLACPGGFSYGDVLGK